MLSQPGGKHNKSSFNHEHLVSVVAVGDEGVAVIHILGSIRIRTKTFYGTMFSYSLHSGT